ncbi:MAG: cation transporter [Rhizorhabdus sp.]|uniref:cation diffusion facilitator family transporter n=1 Tax=Rhizorhabdus sp. TaxID=1968843 RepID=UPI001B447B8F|nr:cation diffusion facilitator family transporter [Rhizorhabdus sp.]MBP8231226.1 cation transporter [Rhizorhabdus sp.]
MIPTTCDATPRAGDCGCSDVASAFDGASPAYKRVLWIVIALNAAMFLVEIVAGQVAGSMALQADALDFLADSLTYGITLAVLGMSLRMRAGAALAKGISLSVMGAYVLGASLWRTFLEGTPEAIAMGAVGAAALAVNVIAALLLLRYRDGDANVRSVWLCSRNDAIGNVAVLAAAGIVAVTGTKWADLGVAAIMAGLFLTSSMRIIRQAMAELKTTRAAT